MGIEVRDGAFGYGSERIIDGLDLPVRDNKVLTILGRNGVGKTTLLKCMMGFLKWDKGETLLDGKPLAGYNVRDVWKRISYVPQAKRSPFAFSVLDTVVMGLNAMGGAFSVPSKEDYEKARDVLDELGMAGIAEKDTSAISGGELQMVLIARALVSDPAILILDEPESNLDMRNQLRVLGAIESISAKGKTTCIINTHFPEHALLVSDDTLFLGGKGRMLLGRTADVVTSDNIREFYGVEAVVVPVELPEADLPGAEPAAQSGAGAGASRDGVAVAAASGATPADEADAGLGSGDARQGRHRLTIYPYKIHGAA